ncbi:MAG: DUF4251 domain-containing protein [Mangrovibacterium sp.]
MKQIVFLIASILLAVTFAGAQNLTAKQRKAQKEQEIKQLIDSRQFRFIARAVIPMAGPRIDLTSTYDLTVDSMKVEAWLPFFGRAYRVEYGDREGGIKFKDEADTMDIKYNKRKKMYNIDFTVDTDKDNYQVRISAGLSGYADVSVNSNNRQSISYYGIIEPLESDKKPQ